MIRWSYETEHPVLSYVTETEWLVSNQTCDPEEEVTKHSQQTFHTLHGGREISIVYCLFHNVEKC